MKHGAHQVIERTYIHSQSLDHNIKYCTRLIEGTLGFSIGLIVSQSMYAAELCLFPTRSTAYEKIRLKGVATDTASLAAELFPMHWLLMS